MSFGKAISAGFINYFNFSDRACRSEFWYWGLFCSVVSIALFFIDAALHNHLLLTVFMIATWFPNLAIEVRRLHDLDASGWWILLSFIPILGIIAIIALYIWFCFKGTEGRNRFGRDPLEPSWRISSSAFRLRAQGSAA